MGTPSPRIGIGRDSHRLAAGGPLVIGGVAVPAEVHAVGHSDADVVIHALADALLGAVGEDDIGVLFPDSDPAHRGLDSRVILAAARRRMEARGYALGNADIVVELERPKLAPHRAAIRESLAGILGVPADRVGIRAKTGEGTGPIGAGELIAATAVALVVRGGKA